MAISRRTLSLLMQRGSKKQLTSRTNQLRSNNLPGTTGWWLGRRRIALLLLRRRQNRLRSLQEAARAQNGDDLELRVARRQRRWAVHPLYRHRSRIGYYHCHVPILREYPEKFYNYFRMSREMYDELLGLVEPKLVSEAPNAIGAGEQLAVTLRYLAIGDYMKSLSYSYLLAPATISKIIERTCKAIWDSLGPLVFRPVSSELWTEVGNEFGARWDFPNCCGAMDGKHVNVEAFRNTGSAFYNYKGSHSIVLLALTNASYQFLAVDIGARGRRSDGGILQTSDFGKLLVERGLDLPPPRKPPGYNEELPFCFIGDGAFPLRPDFLKPYPGTFLPPEEVIFNYRLSRARRIVENSFGIMAARFRIFRRPILAKERSVRVIVQAGTALHNWHCQNNKERYITPRLVDTYLANGDVVEGSWRKIVRDGGGGAFQPLPEADDHEEADDDLTVAGERVRLNFIHFFVDRPLSWQWKKIPHPDAWEEDDLQ